MWSRNCFTLTELLISPTIFSGIHGSRSLIFCVVFCRSLFYFLHFFISAIAMTVLLWNSTSGKSHDDVLKINASVFYKMKTKVLICIQIILQKKNSMSKYIDHGLKTVWTYILQIKLFKITISCSNYITIFIIGNLKT